MEAAQGWFIAGTIVVLIAGGLHVFYALVDTFRPTYFVPLDRSVKPAMEGTGIRLARPLRRGGARPSVWEVWIGVNIGFGIGILTFGLLCLLIVIEDFDLVERIDAIRPLAIAFPAAFLALSLRFFFYGPVLLTTAATVCFALAAGLSA
jgi:hypothetical protein